MSWEIIVQVPTVNLWSCTRVELFPCFGLWQTTSDLDHARQYLWLTPLLSKGWGGEGGGGGGGAKTYLICNLFQFSAPFFVTMPFLVMFAFRNPVSVVTLLKAWWILIKFCISRHWLSWNVWIKVCIQKNGRRKFFQGSGVRCQVLGAHVTNANSQSRRPSIC